MSQRKNNRVTVTPHEIIFKKGFPFFSIKLKNGKPFLMKEFLILIINLKEFIEFYLLPSFEQFWTRTLEMSKNHLIHNFLRNGRLRVKKILFDKVRLRAKFGPKLIPLKCVGELYFAIKAKLICLERMFRK